MLLDEIITPATEICHEKDVYENAVPKKIYEQRNSLVKI